MIVLEASPPISQWQRGSTCLRAKTEEQMQHTLQQSKADMESKKRLKKLQEKESQQQAQDQETSQGSELVAQAAECTVS